MQLLRAADRGNICTADWFLVPLLCLKISDIFHVENVMLGAWCYCVYCYCRLQSYFCYCFTICFV